jgi:WD40 repeat protein
MRALIILLLLVPASVFGQGRFNMTEIKTTERNCGYATVDPDGKWMVTQAYNIPTDQYYILLWSRTATGFTPAGAIPGSFNKEGFYRFGFSPDGNLLIASVDPENYTYVFRKINGKFKKIATLTDSESDFDRFSFSADSRYLCLLDSWDNYVYRIDGNSLTLVYKDKDKSFLCFSPVDPHLAFWNDSICEFSNGKIKGLYSPAKSAGEDSRIKDMVAFSPDGEYLFGFWTDHPALLFRKNSSGKYEETYRLKGFKYRNSHYCVFTPDSRYISVFDEEGHTYRIVVYKIEADTLAEEKTIGQYDDRADNLCFTPDGKLAVLQASPMIWYKVDGVKPAPPRPVFSPSTVNVKTDTIIKTVPPPQVNITNVVWITPNPDVMNDQPVVSEKDIIEIQVKIVSSKVITKDDIKVIINGKEMQKNKFNEVSLKSGEQKDQLNEFTYINAVPLEETPDHINTIAVYANGKNTKTLKVLYTPAKPNLHILSIGASPDRQFSVKDALDFAGLFAEQGKGKNSIYGNVDIKMLLGKDASATAIKESIEKLRYDFKVGAIGPKDVVIIFISSQGFMMDGQLRMQGNDYQEMYKETYSFACSEILSRLNDVGCKKLIFLDAAYSGGAKAGTSAINTSIAQMNSPGTGITVFSSASNDEFSYEDKKWQNSAFVYCIREALSWKSDKDQDGIITLDELYSFVSVKVPELVNGEKKKSQHPQMITDLLRSTPLFRTGN